MVDKIPSFATRPDDPKDVSTGLTTAAASWKRGDRADALRWLRRAVEAASEAELDERALELAKMAADLTTQIGSMAPPRPSAAPSATPSIAPSATPSRPTVPTNVPRVPPNAVRLPPVVSVTKAAFPKTPGAAGAHERPTVTQVPSRETLKKADRKSITNEAPRKRASSRADRAEAPRRPSRTDEIDQWPTDVLAGTDLPPGLGGDTLKPRATTAGDEKGAVRASQAVRVLLWREADGSVHTVAVGSARKAPSDAVEATLAALDPDADLLALLR